MKSVCKIFLVVALLMQPCMAFGQDGPEKAGSIQDGRFILKINDKWTDQQKSSLAELYELDSLLMTAIYDRDLAYINDSTEWAATINAGGMLEISKTIGGPSVTWLDNIILSGFPEQRGSPPPPGLPATYGVNNFSLPGVFSYDQGIACFFLPANHDANRVSLSGSFNQWSTMQLPMQQTDSGWVSCLQLPPGKHLYKYIVDGRWITDPNNRQRERESRRNNNSVVFCPNYTFTLDGHTAAGRVMVAGSFNGWNQRELQMQRTASGWQLALYLREGTHTYKFIVDGQWITDPANPHTRDDGRGNINSLIGLGDSIIFRLQGFDEARRVVLAGSFNDWNTAELLMERQGYEWLLPYVLAADNYEYKFIADGQWMTDPDNPFTTGSGAFTNSFIVFQPNYLFTLKAFHQASQVIVTGSFNGWNTSDYRMVYRGGEWVFPIFLQPERHRYKFIVDGQWMLDPANPLWEDNEFGTGNSVLWIDF